MEHSLQTSGEIAIVNFVKHLLSDFDDAESTIKVENVKSSGGSVFAEISFTLHEIKHNVDFKVSYIKKDSDDEYTGNFDIKIGEDYYEQIDYFNSTVRWFWIFLKEQITE